MRWRFLNPLYTLRLERENAQLARQVEGIEAERHAMVRAREGAKRAAESFYASIGRQAPSGSETDLRSRVVLLQGRVNALLVCVGLARESLIHGRAEFARETLNQILDAPPVDQREAS